MFKQTSGCLKQECAQKQTHSITHKQKGAPRAFRANKTFFCSTSNSITACCSGEAEKIRPQPQPLLHNEIQPISINTSKAALCKKRQTMHSDAHLKCFVFVIALFPLLVCQCRKFHLVQKCKLCKAQGGPLKENNGHRPAEEQTLPLNHLKRH